MKQRSLSLDDIPMLRRAVGAQELRGSCLEVRYHRVHGNSATRDQNSGLARGAEVGFDATALESAGEGQRAVFFTQRTVRTDCQQTLPGSLAAVRHRNVGRGYTDVYQSPTEARRSRSQRLNVLELRVHSADELETHTQCFQQGGHPVFLDDSAVIRDSDDEAACTFLARFPRRYSRQARCDLSVAARPFADAALGRPVAQPERCFGEEGFLRVAQEHEIR